MSAGEAFREYLKLRDARYQAWIDPTTGMAWARDTELIPCPLCESQHVDGRFVKRGFRWVQCRRCGLVYVNPRLTVEVQRMTYCSPEAEFYYAHWISANRNEAIYREELRRIHRCRAPGRLLDIGCGNGEFLHCAQQAGWEVYGVEPNPVAAALARERYQVRVKAGYFETLELSADAFHVVTLFHVLDQLPAPMEVLQRIRHLLVPGGLLVVTVPNIAGAMVRMVGSRHRHFTPEKGVGFTPATLCRLVRRAGFCALNLRTFGEEPIISNLVTLLRTKRQVDLFEDRASRSISTDVRAVTWWRGIRIVSAPLNRLVIACARRLRLGSYMTLYARSLAG